MNFQFAFLERPLVKAFETALLKNLKYAWALTVLDV